MSEQNMNTDEEQITVTLTMEDDEEIDCAVLTTYSANGREYIALLPLNEEGESDDQEEGQQPTLENIEDDDEYDIAADAFDEWMDEQEFEEL